MRAESRGFVLCVEEPVSVALKPFRYEVHGHDVVVRACWCVDREEGRVDIEILASTLSRALDSIDRKPLWEVLGVEDAAIEDLLEHLRERLEETVGPRLCGLEARWRGRSISLRLA